MTNADLNKYASKTMKELRLNKKITQEQLAKNLSITQQQVARYENNKRQFKQDFLFKLAEYFDVPIDTFFPSKESIVNTSTLIFVNKNISIAIQNDYKITANDIIEINKALTNLLENDKEDE